MKYFLNLQLFNDGDSQGESSQDTADNQSVATSQTSAEETETETFDDLIKGKYAKEYKERTENIVKQRVSKAQKSLAEKDATIAQYAPILDALSLKYGLDKTDIAGITESLQNDNSVYEEKAYELGLTVDQYKRMAVVEAENERLRAAENERQHQMEAQAKVSEWQKEAEDLARDFPNFSLDAYLQNQQFQALLSQGVSMRNAYIALDADRILPEAMAYTAKEVQKKTADNIAARGSRPMENGLSGQASAQVKTDVSTLSNEQIADLVNRAQRGEVIRFN